MFVNLKILHDYREITFSYFPPRYTFLKDSEVGFPTLAWNTTVPRFPVLGDLQHPGVEGLATFPKGSVLGDLVSLVSYHHPGEEGWLPFAWFRPREFDYQFTVLRAHAPGGPETRKCFYFVRSRRCYLGNVFFLSLIHI